MRQRLVRLRSALFGWWMSFAHALGRVNTAILLTLVYAVMILPMRLLWFLIRKDALRLRSGGEKVRWETREPEPSTLDERSHPF